MSFYARLSTYFDALPAAKDPVLTQVVDGQKLHFGSNRELPDIVDQLSARLVCSALSRNERILLVLPDDELRRPAIIFALSIIAQAVARLSSGARPGRVAYISGHSGIKRQLADVKIGPHPLDVVFAQQFGHGESWKITSSPSSSSGTWKLPTIYCVHAPADPASILEQVAPDWIALDCADGKHVGWLPAVMESAARLGVPVVGWCSRPALEVLDPWAATSSPVFCWPRVRPGRTRAFGTLQQLEKEQASVEVRACVLQGPTVDRLGKLFSSAAEGLVSLRGPARGRVIVDAVAVGWRYLRALEMLPVPLEVYEREARSFWGIKRVSDLQAAFSRFVEASEHLPTCQPTLAAVAKALEEIHETFKSDEPPVWLGLANACVESLAQRQIVFSSRARRDMFAFALLRKVNVTSDDLRQVGVRLGYLGEQDGEHATDPKRSLFVGVPTQYTERHIDELIAGETLDVLVWPHNVAALRRRVAHLDARLCGNYEGLLRILGRSEAESGTRGGNKPSLRFGGREEVSAAQGKVLTEKAEAVTIWQRPDPTTAVTALFSGGDDADEEEAGQATILSHEDSVQEKLSPPEEEAWVGQALELQLGDPGHVMFPNDEIVNVVIQGSQGSQIDQRYVRSLRVGDEILFIQGQRRQSLYELLVSRVHRDPVIAQFLAMVKRWQDDFVGAFGAAQRIRSLTLEALLTELRSRGSQITSPYTVGSWLRGWVLAPHDAEDLRRIAEFFGLQFVGQYYRQIHKAARRLKGLHINLSVRLNRWLMSSQAGGTLSGRGDELVDEELGLTIEDFRHSLVRAKIRAIAVRSGPFYRGNLGKLERASS